MIAALNNPTKHSGALSRFHLGDDPLPIDTSGIDSSVLFTPDLPLPVDTTGVNYGPAVPSDFIPPSGLEALQYGPGSAGTQIPTANEPVDIGGLQFPVGTVGIDDSGAPVNSAGQVLTPTGAISTSSVIGLVTPLAQAATKIAQIAAGSNVPTVYPAPAGSTLPAGAIGVNAQGYPINAAGQILAPQPLVSSSGLSWFSSSTLISSMPNYVVLGGAVVALAILPALFGGKKKR